MRRTTATHLKKRAPEKTGKIERRVFRKLVSVLKDIVVEVHVWFDCEQLKISWVRERSLKPEIFVVFACKCLIVTCEWRCNVQYSEVVDRRKKRGDIAVVSKQDKCKFKTWASLQRLSTKNRSTNALLPVVTSRIAFGDTDWKEPRQSYLQSTSLHKKLSFYNLWKLWLVWTVVI